MSAWLRHFTALVLLALASTATAAYAPAWEAKNAHRGFAASADLAASEIAPLTASHVSENWHWTAEGSSDLLVYAYANPTVYVDLDGRQACRGHEVDNCPLAQWTSPNRAIPQTIANDALGGDPQLAEVDADRAFALPSASQTPDQHINTELYRLVPHVDPEGDGKAVRFYSAQNRETGQFDWTVPPGGLDDFVANESERMNIAAYSRTMGGTTPSNVEVQRMLRDGTRSDVAGMLSHFGKSWAEGLKDPLFYLNMLGGVAGGSAAKTAGPARAVSIGEGATGRPVARLSADSAAAAPHPGKLAAESNAVSRESVMRALRQSDSVEGAATAKLIKRGVVDINFSDKVLANPAGGVMPYNSNTMLIYRNYAGRPSQAAGLVAHETEHYLQHLTPRQYGNGQAALQAELAAYRVQRSVDPTFYLRSDAEVVNFLVESSLYPQINRRAADAFWQGGGEYVRRMK